jgi:hypothetical protein
MNLTNSTEYPDYMIRRMVSWTCRELGMPAKAIRTATFGNARNFFQGWARLHTGNIWVRVSARPTSVWPHEYKGRFGLPGFLIADRLECFVLLTAHECEHIHQHIRGAGQTSDENSVRIERLCDIAMARVLDTFRANRAELESQWRAEPVRESRAALRAPASIVETRAAHAAAMLDKWERKLARAKTAVAKWNRTVKYYEKKKGVDK